MSCAQRLEAEKWERPDRSDETGSAFVQGRDGRTYEADEILRLLRSGRKVQAIKLHMQLTGAGLKDAKEAVEALGHSHGVRTGARTGGWGCLLVLVVVLLAALAWLG